jgi:hypothetical protein
VKRKYLGLAMAVAVAAYGCGNDGNGGGGGGGGGGGTGIENPAAEAQAQALASDTGEDLLAMSASPDQGSAIGTVFGIYANALAVASATDESALLAELSASVPSEAVGEITTPACVTETGNTVTWDNCNFVTYTVDGTVTVNGDDVEIDLDITTSGVTISFVGTITVTSTLIDGEILITSTVASVGFSVDVIFDQIVITDGCPTGGSITVDPSTSAGPIRTVRADFGPNCGDVALFEE